MLRQGRQGNHIASKCSPGKRTTRPEVRPRANTRVALKSGGDLSRVRSCALAKSRYLVDKRDRKRQKRVQGVLDHLGRFGAHENDLWRIGLEQPAQQFLFCLVTLADNDSLSPGERLDGLPKPQIFRRNGKVQLRKLLLQSCGCANG